MNHSKLEPDLDEYLRDGKSRLEARGAGKISRKTKLAADKARSKAFWKTDNGPVGILRDREMAKAAYTRHHGHPPLTGLFGVAILPGALDAQRASDARRRWVTESLKLHRARRREANQRNTTTFRFFIVVIMADFIEPEGSLHLLDLTKLRRTAQRWIRRLPAGTLTTGVIELVINVDKKAIFPRAWVPHLNLLVELEASSLRTARGLVKKAIPARKDAAKGVYTPIKTLRVYWLRGAMRYASKGLQIHAVDRRYCTLDAKGKRRPTRKVQLGSWERAELAAFMERIQPDHLIIHVGRRRYGNRIQSTSQ